MKLQELSETDIAHIFASQEPGGPYSDVAVIAAGLNRLDRLHRQSLDTLASWQERRQALYDWYALEQKLYAYVRQQTPLNLFDSDYEAEWQHYRMLRQIWLGARSFTFARHGLIFLLDLLYLCHHDVCQLMAERDILADTLERHLWNHYFLYDMGLKKTETVGREAVSNGYHECDFTLEIEDILKEPHKAIPYCCWKYVKKSLPESRMARCIAHWLVHRGPDFAKGQYIIDDNAIEQKYNTGTDYTITSEDKDYIDGLYR